MKQTTDAGRAGGPWIADDHQIFDQDGNRVAVFNGHATPDDEDEYLRWKADAAHAAMAVNSHADLVKALETALSHIEHMAAFIGKQNAGYNFESLGEDAPGMRAALTAASKAQS